MLADAFEAVRGLLGDPPFQQIKDTETAEKKSEDAPIVTTVTKNIVLSDGTYASVTSTETVGGSGQDSEKMPHLRRLVSTGDILLGTVVCVTLTKIALKSAGGHGHRSTMGALLCIAGIGKLAEQRRGNRVGVHADCLDRLTLCARLLLDPALQQKSKDLFLSSCQEAYSHLVAKQKAVKTKASEADKKGRESNPDDLIQFRQLRSQSVQGGIEVDLMDADDISRAIGADGAGG